jgi:cytochrome b pre-mRNA-processing protein 3
MPAAPASSAMIVPLFRRNRHADTIERLYGAIVAQARSAAFYRRYAVPDTAEGRLDMIMLHTVLLLHRLRQGDPALQALGQGVFDRFCRDMDDNLREMGVGDLAVPRMMRRIGAAFYGRAKAYEAGLAGDMPSLVAALHRNIYGQDPATTGHAAALAAYIRAAVAGLQAADAAALRAGEVRFPMPGAGESDA